MAKFSGPSVIAGAQPVLPVDQGQGDFAELFSAEATPVEAPESPQAIAPGLPTPETAAAVIEEPRAVGDIAEAEAAVAAEATGRIPTATVVDETFSEEQRARERVPAFTEKLNRTTLAPSSIQNNQPIELALSRADNVGAIITERVSGAKMTGLERVGQIQAGFPEAAFSSTDPEGNVKVPVAPALRGSNVNVGVQALLYDPRLLNAGKYDEETGRMSLDPEFGRILGLSTEAWLYQQMDASTEVAGEIDEATGIPGIRQAEQMGGQRFTKAQGNQQLGREIFMAYQRQKAVNEGKASDEYLAGIDEISPETFTFIGDMAKEIYAEANPDMVYRDDREVDSGGQVYFQIKPEGARQLDQLSNDFKGLMAQAEVKPLNGVSPTAQPIFEGRMRVRPVTTKVGDLKDWSLVQESMANYHSVAYVNDSGRERLAFLFGMLAMINTNNADNQVYSGMFDVGIAKLRELEGEKRRLFAEAEREMIPEKKAKLLRDAENYNPKKILQGIREKFLNVAGGLAEYSGKENHLTFSMQALTGRTHVQQTLYNPAAHKFVRFAVGGGNIFTWTPRSGGEIETAWKEIISGLLFTTAKEGKSFKGTELSTAERLKLFEETIGTSQWNQLVIWGNQLKDARDKFNVDAAKQAVLTLRRAQSPDQVQQIKKDMVQRFGNDPLDAGLKAELAKHGTEGAMFANLFIDIANYQNAIDKKSQFSTTITVEMDGKTHGPATNAGLLGIQSMAKRTGLIVEQDYSNTDWLDSRKAMGEWMQDHVEGVIEAAPDNQRPYLKDILSLAIKDRANFLKKSPMTMGYGQELPSLKMHVETTVYSGPQAADIKRVADAAGISLSDTVNFLHTMLVDSIFEIMDPKVVAMGRLLKANGLLSVISNDVLYFDNAMGFRSYAAGKQMDPEATTSSSFEFKKGEKGRKKVAVQFYKEKAEGSAERVERGPGGWTMGRIIPVSVQSYDGNMIARTGSGESWQRISSAAKAKGAKPFVLPIFDAFVTDLGTFAQVRNEANQNWLNGLRDHSYIESIAGTWFEETQAKIAERFRSVDPNAKVNLEEDGPYRGLAFMLMKDEKGRMELGKAFSKVMKAPRKTPGISISDYTAQLDRAGQDLAGQVEAELRRMGIDIEEPVKTNKEIYRIIRTITNMLELPTRNKEAIAVTSRDKAALLSKVKADRLTQMDL